jgi:hypothetical protein
MEMSETPNQNLQGLLRTLKQQDAMSLRSLLANEVNAVQEVLKLSGHNTRWDQRHVGLLLDRWSNVVTLMHLSESIEEAYKPKVMPVKHPPSTSPVRAESAGPEIVRRAIMPGAPQEYSVD